ncbi:MAG TPA: hypothetical protein VGD98_20345 [Ktedonobacteraceae bacterium]
MSKRPVQKRLLHMLTLSLVILLAGGGIALLYQWQLGTMASYASGDNVVGQPSLPAANVDAILQRLGSPMVGTGKAVEAASHAQNIDDAFALAVWWTETNDGAAGVGLADRNPGSVRGSIGYPSAYDGYTIYPSYTDAVNYWFYMLKKVYIERGLTTVSAISHPYVGTSTSDLWAGKVIALMQKYRAEAPPPVTPTPTVPPDLKRQGRQLSQEQQQQGTGKTTYHSPVVQQNPVSASQAHDLNGGARTVIVPFALLLALLLALWSWSINRRYSRRQQLAPAPQATSSNVWEQMRASGQQPVSFFNGFNGPLRITENLMPANVAQPDYDLARDLLSTRAFGGAQSEFPRPQTPQPEPVWLNQASPSFNVPITDYARPASLSRPQPALPARLPQSPLHRTRLQPAGDTPERQPQAVNTSNSGGGLLSRYRDIQAQNNSEL